MYFGRMMDDWWILVLVIGFMVLWAYRRMRMNRRVYRRLPDREFPRQWRSILEQRVPFYQRLSSTDREKFEYQIHVFLLNFQIVGEGTEVTDLDRVLVASGGTIPVFRLEKWHYKLLKKVVIYPEKFLIPETDKMASGLVGWGAMKGQMWLSRKALYQGFHIDNDQKNVAIHEFIHLMDMQDGMVDGVLESLMDDNAVEPWLELVKEKSDRIGVGYRGTIREYAKANPIEFLAATGEFYFESPDKLRREHPDLYQHLDAIFSPTH